MPNRLNLQNQKFGRITVLKYIDKSYWLCICNCGKTFKTKGTLIKNNHTRSCGCLQKEIAKKSCIKRCTTHNKTYSKIYNTWKGMLQRCYNKKDPAYKNYGGRGIKVCKKWHKFKNFLNDMGSRPNNKCLERKHNNKNYDKNNCIWVSMKKQCRNKRNNHIIIYKNKKLTITEWAEKSKINKSVILKRLKNGWSIKKTLTTKVRKYIRRKTKSF